MSKPTPLKRSITLPLLTLFGLGNILGAGIYVLIGKVAGIAGLYTPLAFLVAAGLATFTAFSYAELSARMPLSAGEAVYVQAGFHRRTLSLAVGILIALSGIVSAAAITRGFVGYLDVFIALPHGPVIVLTLVALGLLAVWGISESVMTASLVTVLEVGGLLLVVWAARDAFGALPAQAPDLIPPLEGQVWVAILLGAFLAFYAFIGFEDMVNVAEEVHTPERVMPASIFLALALATLLYMGVSLAAVLSVPAAALAASDAPIALVFAHATGEDPRLIAAISLIAVINGALVQIIMASRVAYGIARQGWAPQILGSVDPRTRTPVVATALVTAIIIAFALFLDISALARLTSLFILVIFAAINLALVLIKRRDPQPAGIRTYPIVLPVVGFVSCLGFVAFQAFQTLMG